MATINFNHAAGKMKDALDALVGGWDRVALDPDALAPALQLMRHHDAITQEERELRNDTSYTDEIARRVATEEITFREGIQEHLKASACHTGVYAGSTSNQARYSVLARAAQRAMLELLVEELRGAVVVLDEAREALIADVAKLAPTLDGIDSAEAADEAGPKAEKAWRRLVELGKRHYTLGTCWTALERLYAVDPARRPAEFGPSATVYKMAQAMAVA